MNKVCTDTHLIKENLKTELRNGQNKLENVSTANALQLEAGQRHAVPIRFNFVARAKFEVAQPICCRLRAYLLLIRYVTL